MKISIVSPVYNASLMIDELVKTIIREVSLITSDYEIILVEDGSRDDSWQKIESQCRADAHVKGMKLSRNFGQHQAIYAGLRFCTGEWVVVMDCDLQDRPEEIKRLYAEALKGYDIVFARRGKRRDAFLKKITSVIFYSVFSYLSGLKQDGRIANYGIFSRKVINTLTSMKEPVVSFTVMARWVGFNKTSVVVEHGERAEGRSTYNWGRLIELALNISVAYSDKPLKLAVKLGLLISSLSFLFALYNLGLYLFGFMKVPGFTSLIISLWFLSGLIILILGIVGLYIGKAFDGIKQRPSSIIDITINL